MLATTNGGDLGDPGVQAVVGQVVMTDGTIQPVLASAPSTEVAPQPAAVIMTTAAPMMMPGRECRRQSEPLRAQHLWDAIRAVRQQKQIPAIQVCCRLTHFLTSREV